jgi:hypothetical protein
MNDDCSAGDGDAEWCELRFPGFMLARCSSGWDSDTCASNRAELEESCITSEPVHWGYSTYGTSDAPEGWLCAQLFWAYRAAYEPQWSEYACMDMLQSTTREEGLAQAAVDFCQSYTPVRHRVGCNDPFTWNLADREAFCGVESWDDSWLVQRVEAPCTATYDSAEEASRCRSANEEQFAAECIATDAEHHIWGENPPAGTARFCAEYGNQRYQDFCGPDAVDEGYPGVPTVTVDGTEHMVTLEQFCSLWPTHEFADPDAAQADDADAGGEGDAEADAEEEGPRGAPDVIIALGGTSPFCARKDLLSEESREACEMSGAIAHRYPLVNYGLDVHFRTIEGIETGFEGVLEIALGVLQTLGGLIWMLVVYLLKFVLLLLEWAFEVPLIKGCENGGDTAAECVDAMPAASDALLNLHQNVLGTPWMLAAISAAGLWGLWNGLVRMRFSATVAGLVATVLLMALALAIINRPAETVGAAAKLSSDASLGVLNATGRFGADNPTGSFAEAQQGLFDAIVTRPWCALQFGDVEWCMEERPGAGASVADVWLAFPPGSVERENFYKLAKGDGVDDSGWAKTGDVFQAFGEMLIDGLDPGMSLSCDDGVDDEEDLGLFDNEGRCNWADDWEQRDDMAAVEDELMTVIGDTGISEEKVRLQEPEGTLTRLPLIGLVVLTQIAAILVLLWIAIRLATAAVMVLVLLMLAPVWLLAPALGDTGRSAFLTYLKRLATFVAAKLLFALILTVVLLISDVIATLDLNWFPLWLLQLAFWWGILLKRQTLMSYAGFHLEAAATGNGADSGHARTRGLGLMQAYFGYRALKDVGGDLRNVVTAPARAIRRGQDVAGRAQTSALKDRFGRQAGDRANQGLAAQRASKLDELRRRKGDLEAQLGPAKTARQAAERALQTPEKLRDQLAQAEVQRDAAELRRQAAEAARDQADDDVKNSAPDPASTKRAQAAYRAAQRGLTAAETDLQDKQDAMDSAEEALLRYPSDRLHADQLAMDERNIDQQLRSVDGDIYRSVNAPADFSERERSDWIENRRGAIERGADPAADEQLIAAGIDPGHYRSAAPDVQAQLYERSAQAMEEDRGLFARVEAESLPADVQRRELAAAAGDRNFVDDVERHRQDERAADKQEHRQRKNRRRYQS